MSLIPYKISHSCGAMVVRIAGGLANPPMVQGVGTKKLGKGRVKNDLATHGFVILKENRLQ